MYSIVCPNCGKKSDKDIQQCPVCGYIKSEPVARGSIFKDINDSIVEKLSFLDYPQVFVTVITRLVIMLFIIFVIPGFISNSEFFWIVIGVFSVYGLIKEIAKSYSRFILLYKISKIILFAYFGAGFGNIISHAGRLVYYRFSYYFNLEFLYDQFSRGNSMIIVGVIYGLIILVITNKFRNEFRVEDKAETES